MLLVINILEASSPYDFFRDPVWQFIGVIVAIIFGIIAIIALVISIQSYRQQQHFKEISYEVISNAPIVSVDKAFERRVKIELDGVQLKDSRLMVMKVWNSGNVSVRAEDYFEPIRFEFNEGSVISADILETDPPDLINPEISKSFFKIW